MPAGNTIEIVQFKLKDGVQRDKFVTENRGVEQSLVSKMPGFVSRETAIADDGQVAVLLHWESPEAAQNSMNKFVAAPESQTFQTLIDMSTFAMTRYTKL
ncbi:MAG TPA: hypothetical protein VNA04_18095 [Thermoanaerobaculia bacterium]|nr:hypothetical protein [Thermoanaerobaculia bacterium]